MNIDKRNIGQEVLEGTREIKDLHQKENIKYIHTDGTGITLEVFAAIINSIEEHKRNVNLK